jgi:Na+-driven multidrug efflux pump
LGAPRLEIQGAAISTVIARFVELAIISVYMYTMENKIRYRVKYLFMRKIGLLRDFIKHAGPVVVNEIVWGTGAATLAAIIGRMGTEFTAANSITMVLIQLVHIAGYGLASAAAAIVGNVVGSGDYAKARAYGNSLMFISFGMGILSSITIHILKIPLLSLYNVSDTVIMYARQLINICSVLVVFQSMAHMAIVGVLRGGGDTRFALFIDILFMWVVCIPLGFFTGLHLGWAVPVVFFIIKVDEFFKGTSGFIRVIRGKWVYDVTIN